jgi:hypothetical protein
VLHISLELNAQEESWFMSGKSVTIGRMPTAKHDNAQKREASPGAPRSWWVLVGLFWLTVFAGSGLMWLAK